MEPKMERQEVAPRTVEEAVRVLTQEHNEARAIGYLRAHRDDVGEFCVQVTEVYRSGDNTGARQLGKIIESLL